MTILPLASASRASEPFCDYLNVTVPRSHCDALGASLSDFMSSWGVYPESGAGVLYRLGNGTIKLKPYGKVVAVSASGSALHMLRLMGAYSAYLHVLGAFPHRVSMLHATCDYHASNPPSVIAEVKRAAYLEQIQLTRKRVQAKHVKHIFCVDLHGQETGTVYLGQRANADVWAKVYDKYQEQLSRGVPTPPLTVRVEVAIQSDMGATLLDAHQPTAIFYHFAGRSLVEVPADVRPWEGLGEGYSLPASEIPLATVYQQCQMIIDGSPEIRRLRKLASAEWGDRAAEHIGHLIMRGGVKLPS